MNLREMMDAYSEEGLTRDLAAARVCQDIVLKAIAEGPLNRNVTIKGGVVMRSLTHNNRRATAVLTGMPHSPNRGTSSFADTICKIIDLQEEINTDIDRYVDIKRNITECISRVSNTDYRLLLEKRYLKGEKWEEIAVDLGYDLRWVHRLHKECGYE